MHQVFMGFMQAVDLTDRDELREWVRVSGPLVRDRRVDRAHYRNFDTARRWAANPEMQDIHHATWMSRSDCFAVARLKVGYARKMFAHGAFMAALDALVEAEKWRQFGKSKPWEPPPPPPAAKLQKKPKTQILKPATDAKPIELPSWCRADLERIRARREALLAEIAARPALPPPEPDRPLAPGDRVILARTASSGWADGMPRRPWTMVACECGLCAAGSHVALDVPTHPGLLAMYPELGPWRHVAASAVRRRGELSRAQAEAWCESVSHATGEAVARAHEAGHSVVSRDLELLMFSDALGGFPLAEVSR